MFLVLSQTWDKEKILSSHMHGESNLRPLDSALQCSTTEPERFYGEWGPLQSSYMTRVMHTVGNGYQDQRCL